MAPEKIQTMGWALVVGLVIIILLRAKFSYNAYAFMKWLMKIAIAAIAIYILAKVLELLQ